MLSSAWHAVGSQQNGGYADRIVLVTSVLVSVQGHQVDPIRDFNMFKRRLESMTWTEYCHHYFTSQFLKFANWCAVAHGLGARLTEGVIDSPRPGSSMTFRSGAVGERGFDKVCLPDPGPSKATSVA